MRNYLLAGAAAALMTLSGGVAIAQQAPAAQQPAMPAFDQPDWTKVCATSPTGKEICQTIRDLRSPDLEMSAQISQEKGGKPKLIVMVPSGMVLSVGARIVVDDQTLDTAKYSICNGPYCFAELPLTDANLATMKKGKKLIVQLINIQGQSGALTIGLDGFGKVNDGPGVDPKTFQATQQAYVQKLSAIFQPFIDAQRAQQQSAQPNPNPAIPDTPAPAPAQPAQ